MPKIDVYDVNGKKVKELELNESVFGIEPNENVVHSVVVNYLANQRQGTQNTKTRAEVSGGGRKPWRQKGTGRARQGSIRAPQWIKGGIALGPRPRSYVYKVNKKERALAVRSVLSAKVQEQELVVVDKLSLKEIKTAEMVKTLANLKVEGKAVVLLPANDVNVQKSARNIEGVKTLTVDTINVYDLLKYNKLVVTEDTVKKLEEVYA
ncbi:50S ribosomal protein L4 [Clostridium sp. CAG:793]|mgnify:FL=1|jgi:large subunit ribosomal protein L4|nr:50S ribosomal protein L4 [Clostridium sp. CAG:793]